MGSGLCVWQGLGRVDEKVVGGRGERNLCEVCVYVLCISWISCSGSDVVVGVETALLGFSGYVY